MKAFFVRFFPHNNNNLFMGRPGTKAKYIIMIMSNT